MTMFRLPVVVIFILLTGCVSLNNAPDGITPTASDSNMPLDPIQEIADEFRNLRAVKGHFGGGDWNDDVDKWMGRKHQLMIRLADHFGTGEYDKTQLVQALAQPDVVAREGDDLYNLVSNTAEFARPATSSYELLIYYWRGAHDFIYFTIQGEHIISSGWWYAGE